MIAETPTGAAAGLDTDEIDRLIGRAEGRLVRLERLRSRVGAVVLAGRDAAGKLRVSGHLSV